MGRRQSAASVSAGTSFVLGSVSSTPSVQTFVLQSPVSWSEAGRGPVFGLLTHSLDPLHVRVLQGVLPAAQSASCVHCTQRAFGGWPRQKGKSPVQSSR